ncbi:MAG: GTP cyclohydrolase I [Bauldia sp.]|nr:GTP cyclohydrolase I [Bauldia sp.]MCW5717563.1 GTP cyclohydrolase I [Bauldia sp.]
MTASAHPLEASRPDARPSRAEAEAAVRVLIRWAGDDPARPGLLDTPDRVLRSYDEAYAGYGRDPAQILEAACTGALDQDMIVVRGIRFASRSDQDMAPLVGDAMVAYIPGRRVVDADALGLAVDALSRRLQSPATMASLLASALDRSVRPVGAAVLLRTVRVAALMSRRSTEDAATLDAAYTGTLSTASPWHGRLASLIMKERPIRVGPSREP